MAKRAPRKTRRHLGQSRSVASEMGAKVIARAVASAPGMAAHGSCVRAYEEMTKAWYYHGVRVDEPSHNEERRLIVKAQDRVDARCRQHLG